MKEQLHSHSKYTLMQTRRRDLIYMVRDQCVFDKSEIGFRILTHRMQKRYLEMTRETFRSLEH